MPLGGSRAGFNFNLDDKRVINMVNEVSDEDNVKQDMSIDVYGRKDKDEDEVRRCVVRCCAVLGRLGGLQRGRGIISGCSLLLVDPPCWCCSEGAGASPPRQACLARQVPAECPPSPHLCPPCNSLPLYASTTAPTQVAAAAAAKAEATEAAVQKQQDEEDELDKLLSL